MDGLAVSPSVMRTTEEVCQTQSAELSPVRENSLLHVKTESYPDIAVAPLSVLLSNVAVSLRPSLLNITLRIVGGVGIVDEFLMLTAKDAFEKVLALLVAAWRV